MHRFYYEFQATCLLMLFYHSWSKPLHGAAFLILLIFLWNVRITYHFFSSKKYSHSNIYNNIYNQSTNLQNVSTVHISYYLRESWWKRVHNCVKTHKGIWESCRKLLWFLWIVYSVIVMIESSKYTLRSTQFTAFTSHKNCGPIPVYQESHVYVFLVK